MSREGQLSHSHPVQILSPIPPVAWDKEGQQSISKNPNQWLHPEVLTGTMTWLFWQPAPTTQVQLHWNSWASCPLPRTSQPPESQGLGFRAGPLQR